MLFLVHTFLLDLYPHLHGDGYWKNYFNVDIRSFHVIPSKKNIISSIDLHPSPHEGTGLNHDYNIEITTFYSCMDLEYTTEIYHWYRTFHAILSKNIFIDHYPISVGMAFESITLMQRLEHCIQILARIF